MKKVQRTDSRRLNVAPGSWGPSNSLGAALSSASLAMCLPACLSASSGLDKRVDPDIEMCTRASGREGQCR